ncbi:MAG: secretion protein HlyD [Nitrospira sp. SG-bin1]|nr:MAG: secretion protein HlyD [Nitrospira sp. SG-bin1]
MTRRYLILMALMAVLVISGYVAINRWVLDSGLPDGLIQANGRIEGDHVTIASKFPGRVVELSAREGDSVVKDQRLVRLDDIQTRAKVEQARRLVDMLEAQVQAAHASLAVLNLEVPLAIEAAQAKVDSAVAALEKTSAVEQEARRDLARMRALLPEQAVSHQLVEQTEARWRAAAGDQASAKGTVAQARKELAQAELGGRRIQTKEKEVAALEQQRDQADAALAEVASILSDLTITAPTNGTITTRMVDVGEVVSAGTPLLELVDLDRLYLQVFVPEIQIGKLRLALPARIYTDAFPDRPYDATVKYISSRAEFTPKEVQTRDERVKLIYAVRLYLAENPEHRLTPGLPADAIIRWKEDVAWAKPRG